ncbi:MAG: hypothetical protein GXY53_05530 [Desulfobulbus sp.]|nr:hypothetical protein [Desulfobulbus sp.]
MPTPYWNELSILLLNSDLQSRRRLRRPCPVPLPPDPVIRNLSSQANRAGLLPLLERHLLTCLALPAAPRPQKNRLAHLLAKTFPDYPVKSLITASWCCLPVLTCQDTAGSVTWLLLGRIPGEAGITFSGTPQPAISSMEAANAALSAVMQALPASPHRYPALFLQHPDDPPVTGGSLGLPLALGILLLDKEIEWPPGVFASGGMTADGIIQPVTDEEAKYKTVSTELQLLLFPETGLLETSPQDSRIVRCPTLADAILALDFLAVDADPQQIAHYRACLSRPALFLQEFATLPIALLSVPEGRRLLIRIQNERKHLFAQLVNCLKGCQNDPERADIIARLLSPDDVLQLSREKDDTALPALDWCIARIATANRRGDVADSSQWSRLARNIGRQLSSKKKVDCANHLFVTTRFNCYWFTPDPPEEFTTHLQKEEQIYQLDQCDNRLLGAMYGTLAQNYGFCGPQYRKKFVDCIAQAEQAFGRSHHDQKMRLFAYQIYSLLDCSQLQEAKTLLYHYLQLPEKSTPEQWIDQVVLLNNTPTEHTAFQIAVVCRLLTELVCNGQLSAHPAWHEQLASLLPAHLIHPWQLTAYNLGRLFLMLNKKKPAVSLLYRSVTACMDRAGTMLPMALLSLAQLSTIRTQADQALETSARVLQQIKNSEQLHPAHFAPLVTAPSPEQALKKVLDEPARFFPFSYR